MNITDSLKMAELHACQVSLDRCIGELLMTIEHSAKELRTLQAAVDHIDLRIAELLHRCH